MTSRLISRLQLTNVILIVATLTFFTSATNAAEEMVPPGLKLVAPQIPEEIVGSTRDLNLRLSKDVEPVKNSVVHLVQMFGESVLPPDLRSTSLKMLGIEKLDPDLPRFIYFQDFVRQKHPGNKQRQEECLETLQIEFHNAAGVLWKSGDFPMLAEYFEKNKEQLDRLIKIADLPSYYAPIISVDVPPSLISASFAVEYRLPYLAQCLSTRAMCTLSQGDFSAAEADLIAAHKLALLVATGSPLDVSMAKAHWIDSNPSRSELEIVRSGKLTAEQAKKFLADLQNLPRLPNAAVSADIGERYTMRQEVELLRDDDSAMYGFFDWDPAQHLDALSKLRANKINWELAIKRADEVQDEVVKVMLIEDTKKQNQEITRLNAETEEWKKASDADESSLNEKLAKDPDAGSRWIGEEIAKSLRTNIWQRINTDNRGAVRRDFAIVGFALAAYRQQHGKYPAKLSDLTPEFLSSLPLDAHADKSFDYEKLADGQAKLISLGADRISNSGTWPNDDLILELK